MVLAPIHLGAHLLLYTPHSIVAAGYHRASDGIVAGIRAFAGSEGDLRDVATRSHADYVAICPDWLVAPPSGPEPFAKALADGATTPWLQPVQVHAGPLRVWRVIR